MGETAGAASAAAEIETNPSFYLARAKRLADSVGEDVDTHLKLQKLHDQGDIKGLLKEFNRLKEKQKQQESNAK